MMQEQDNRIAIRITDLKKVYKLYDKPSDRLKETFGLAKGRYKEHYALGGINMKIRQGETVGIIGTNGSGKSTLLKIITGVLSPTAGEVCANGRISALLELGAGFNQEYNGIENIYLNGTMMGFSEKEIRERVPEILKFADIGDYVYQPVKTYSSGMFVRLAFAVAINIDPEILIVDEALSVGDVFFQAKCYHKFEEFKSMGKTIVFVSHDLSSISKYCDRVFLLNKGTLLGEGSPKEMIDAYKRVLVGQYEIPEKEEGTHLLEDTQLNAAAAQAVGENVSRAQTQGQHAPQPRTEGENASRPQGAGENASRVQIGQEDSPQTGEAAGGSVNPEKLEYGTKQAEILEFYITDDQDVRTTAVIKGTSFQVHMVVRFHERLVAPIFAFTFKNVRGTEITGTNSMIEKAFLEPVEAGSLKEVTFEQKMSLQGGEYLLSLGVTGYAGSEFEVYHRLYDVLNVTVVSDKNTVGFYDMDSRVCVRDAAAKNRKKVIPYRQETG